MRFRIVILLTSIAAAAAAQEKPAVAPLQLAIPISHLQAGVTTATVNFPLKPDGTRLVIEHVSARCQFTASSPDRAAEILLNTVDAKGNLHQYNLILKQGTTETPDPYNSNISYVSEAIRTYHDGGTAGTSPLEILLRFSNLGLQYPAVCRAEASGYTVATQATQ